MQELLNLTAIITLTPRNLILKEDIILELQNQAI
jgi:hypothetical protein